MSEVLIDTSIWIDHFRSDNESLAGLMALDRILIHPLIIGEIVCETPPIDPKRLAIWVCLFRRDRQRLARWYHLSSVSNCLDPAVGSWIYRYLRRRYRRLSTDLSRDLKLLALTLPAESVLD